MRRDLRRLVAYLRACVGNDAGPCLGDGTHQTVAQCNAIMTEANMTCAAPAEHHRPRPRWRSITWWVG